MNCQEALSLLYDIIDKEASEVDTKLVEQHLAKCRDCMDKYRLERSIQAFLNERLQNGDQVEAHQELRTRVLDRLDDVDTGDRPLQDAETPRPFRLPAVALVAAASVVILLGAAFFGSRFSSHSEHFTSLGKAHWTAEGSVGELLPESDLNLVLAGASDDFQYALNLAVADYQLVSGNPAEILGHQMMHCVYVSGESVVSVFLAPADCLKLLVEAGIDPIERNAMTLFDHNCRGCRLVFHRAGNAVIITATTDRSVELLDFIPGNSAI